MLCYLKFVLVSFAVASNADGLTDSEPARPNLMGGAAIPIQHLPYTVSILDGKGLWCTGSILTNYHVLTSGYCVFLAKTDLIVHAGTSYWRKGGSFHRVVYNATINRDIDIAVLSVKEPLEFDETRQPVGLFSSYDTLTPDTKATVTGWRNNDLHQLSEQLRAVTIPIIDFDTCNRIYTSIGRRNIAKGQLCAGRPDSGSDPCQGDAGAPLVIKGRQVGIASAVFGCARHDAPGIFTSVGYYSKWIYQQIS